MTDTLAGIAIAVFLAAFLASQPEAWGRMWDALRRGAE